VTIAHRAIKRRGDDRSSRANAKAGYGLSGTTKTLEPMQIADTTTYGGFFIDDFVDGKIDVF
jgi:hypothetical protein